MLTLLFRPVVLNLIYFVFYEPLGRIEEGDIDVLKRTRKLQKDQQIDREAKKKGRGKATPVGLADGEEAENGDDVKDLEDIK